MHTCFKRLGSDIAQVCRTLSSIRECTNTLNSLDANFKETFMPDNKASGFQDLYTKIDESLSSWTSSLKKQQLVIDDF
jgi:hypothetical protein